MLVVFLFPVVGLFIGLVEAAVQVLATFVGVEFLKGFVALVRVVVPKGFLLLVGVTILKGFVTLVEAVVLKGFVAPEEFAVLPRWAGMGTLPFAGPTPFARFAHVLPQYGWTMKPSLYLGFFLQCLVHNLFSNSPPRSERTLTLHNERAGFDLVFELAFTPAPRPRPPPRL